MDSVPELRGKLEAVKRMYNAQADANVALEDELHATRVALAAVEAQRDVLLERLISLEGDAWEVSSEDADERPALPPAAKRRAVKSGEKAATIASTTALPPIPATAAKASKRARAAAAAPAGAASEDRTGLCSATLKSGKLCRRKATTGFVYCGYHLPLDPLSGFMYCTHLKAGGKTCGNPVLKDSDRLCKYHRPANEGGQARAAAMDGQGNFDDDEDDDDM